MKRQQAIGKTLRTFIAGLGIAAVPWLCARAAPASAKPYILTAAPRETAARGQRDYGPIAAFLAKVLHHPVVYRHPDGWLSYELWLWKDHADIYFEGPQFVAWQLDHLQQTLGPRIPQPQDWRLYTWKGSPVQTMNEAATGASLCTPPIPNFGALWVMGLFPDPTRQPYVRDMHGWKSIYKAVHNHQCALGIGPKLTLDYLDPKHTQMTILSRSVHYPNQAFAISAKLPQGVRTAIVRALLSPAGEQALLRLRKRFAHGRRMIAGHASQYQGVADGLDAQWGTIYATQINHYLRQDAKREGIKAVLQTAH